MNQLAQDLRAARALIDTPEKCVLDTDEVRDKDGRHLFILHGSAFSMSPDCAVFRTVVSEGDSGGTYNVPSNRLNRLQNAIRAQVGLPLLSRGRHEGIHVWVAVPERTHAEVMAAFDKAIEKAEAQP